MLEPTKSTEEVSEPAVNVQQTRPVTLKTMLESGVHYGHKRSAWNPKMAPYIFGLKDDIYIIDLQVTLQKWQEAKDAIFNCISEGGTIMFSGRRKKTIPHLEDEAKRAGAFYLTGRWPGGTITNFGTVQKSVNKMKELEDFVENSSSEVNKRELLSINRELGKLHSQFNGIRDMKKKPDMLFVTNGILDKLAIDEARQCRIPVVGLADTNVDPDLYDYIIPANDDALMSLDLFITNVAETVLQGRTLYETNMEALARENVQATDNFIEDELA